jgi:hypothetical protein
MVLQGFSGELRRQKQRFTAGFAGTKKGPASTWQAGVAWNAETETRA